MAFYDTAWYTNFGDGSTTGYYAVALRPQNAAAAAGVLRRQFTAPAVGSERVFVCIIAGTTANVTDATWVLTRGAKTTDGTATWQECTGASAVNGDLTNTANWTQAKAIGVPTLGAIIQRNSGASYQICSTAGTMGTSEPAFSNTAGVTTTETAGTAVWTCLGPVGNFTGGQAPHARLANACTATWFAPGNTVYVGDNHAETQASAMTFTITGNSANTIGKILCHNHSGSYPPASGNLMTGATVATSGANAITITSSGSLYVYGLIFKAGVGASTGGGGSFLTIQGGPAPTNQNWITLDSCSLQIANTAAVCIVTLGNTVNTSFTNMILNNTTVYFGATTDYVSPLFGQFRWQNTGQILASGSSVPAQLIGQVIGQGCVTDVVLEAIDLSQLTGSIFTSNLGSMGSLNVKDCKLNAATTVGTPSSTGQINQLVRCDSGATGYKSARYQYEGTETTETSITRVGGASDPTGQAQSRKIVTTANSLWLRPFKAEPYAIWGPTIGSNVTVTVCGTVNAGALPMNDDIWLEVEYLGSSATPLGTIVTTTKSSLLAANAAVASDGSTWNGGGSGAGWLPFKLTITLSSPQPGLAGYIHARVRAAKPSTTYYIDPMLILT